MPRRRSRRVSRSARRTTRRVAPCNTGPVSCPAAALLDTWTAHPWAKGLQLEQLADLDALQVRTRNSTYEITVVSVDSGDVLVRGGAYFPEFRQARLAGSSLGGSLLKLRGIYVGFRMELHVGQQAIVTSEVHSIGVRAPHTWVLPPTIADAC